MEQYEATKRVILVELAPGVTVSIKTSLRKVVAVSPGGLSFLWPANVEVEEPQAQTIEAVTESANES